MHKLVKIFKDEKYIGPAFIEGMKLVEGYFGWFPTLEVLTMCGEKLEGWQCSIHPFSTLIEYTEVQNEEQQN